MRKYELTVVLDAKATAAKRKSFLESLGKIISVFKGKMGTAEEWGEKPAGYFIHIPLELEPGSAKGFSAKLKVEDAIIKYLLVRKEK